jgi:hypothetical protein
MLVFDTFEIFTRLKGDNFAIFLALISNRSYSNYFLTFHFRTINFSDKKNSDKYLFLVQHDSQFVVCDSDTLSKFVVFALHFKEARVEESVSGLGKLESLHLQFLTKRSNLTSELNQTILKRK